MRPIARRTFPLAAFLLAAVSPLAAQQPERLDYQMLGRIRDEGMQRSQAMDIISWLADVKGPRLTGSPGFKAAGDWTIETLKKWGMSNVHYEPWSFGRGWSLERFSAHMIEPEPTIQPLIGYPKAWSPGTGGVVSGDVVQVTINAPADFEKYRGKLKGKIVLPQAERVVRMLEGDIVLKMGDKEVKEAETTPIPAAGGAARFTPPAVSAAQLNKFYVDEGVVAVLDRGADSDMSAGGSDMSWQTQRVDGGTIFVGSAGSRDASAVMPPQVTLAVEHYNRLVRLISRGIPVRMEVEIKTAFHAEGAQPNGINTIAEIPGTDLAHEVVILGAHMDGVPYATGATDNATGSAAMMEALRILKTLGVQPRRTIRIGLWGAEEQGLLGSREYVKQHIADGATLKPEHAKHSAYFNIDNGTGKIRGIWFQQNFGVQPVFQQWITPLADLGVTTLGPRNVSSTDHLPFDAAGIPGFQFIQERLEYNSRTHHSNMDVVDRVQRGDMMQMATVVAWFAYNASMRDEKLPRKAMPAPRVAQ